MVSRNLAVRYTGLEWVSATARPGASTRMRAALSAVLVATFALALSTSARAATITVDSLADTGAPGICVLRDAITAANTKTATNDCAAGTGDDTINFSVTGTISLASTLPQVTDGLLKIIGPASPGIAIDGGGQVRVMQVASNAAVNLKHLSLNNALINGFGGGILNDGTLTVTNSTFRGNIGNIPFGGGGIFNDGTLTVTNSTFSDNRGFNGHGIFNFGTLTVSNSTFAGNGVSGELSSGGAIYNEGPLTVSNSTFSGNRASVAGGGIANVGRMTVISSTFARNSTSGCCGGAISNDVGTATVTNSTFDGNSGGGGAIVNGTTLTLKSTILAANSGDNCNRFFGPITDGGYNISDDNTCEFSATGSHNSTDPMLDPNGLQNNGGPTQTIALISGSPAIDAMPLADCTDQASPPNPIITDQRLFPRPDAEERRCDIGAYEFADIPFLPFSSFRAGLTIHPDTGVFLLNGKFNLGSGGSIDPTTQPVAFGVGSYAVRLPVGSFTKYSSGYVYQKKINGIFLCLYIKFTSTPDRYILLAYRKGGSLTGFTSPVPLTLTIGDNSGSTLMTTTFN